MWKLLIQSRSNLPLMDKQGQRGAFEAVEQASRLPSISLRREGTDYDQSFSPNCHLSHLVSLLSLQYFCIGCFFLLLSLRLYMQNRCQGHATAATDRLVLNTYSTYTTGKIWMNRNLIGASNSDEWELAKIIDLIKKIKWKVSWNYKKHINLVRKREHCTVLNIMYKLARFLFFFFNLFES